MITATAILRKEHDTILGKLDAAEEVARQLDRGEPVAPETLTELLDFFWQFAERGHLGKEEDLLFPLLEKKGLSRAGTPMGMILAEHQKGRSLLRVMEGLAEAYGRGSPAAAQRWAESAWVYTAMLRFHIEVENKVLFLTAENLLTEAEQSELASAFEKTGENKPEDKETEKTPLDGCTFLWIG